MRTIRFWETLGLSESQVADGTHSRILDLPHHDLNTQHLDGPSSLKSSSRIRVLAGIMAGAVISRFTIGCYSFCRQFQNSLRGSIKYNSSYM